MVVKLILYELLLSTILISRADATPLARIHVKFSQPPHQIQEHGITTHGGKLVSQQSFLLFGRTDTPMSFDPASQSRNTIYNPINPAQFRSPPIQQQQQQQPQQSLYPSLPVMVNDIRYGRHHHHESGQTTPNFSDGLASHDPQLLTGDAAVTAVGFIYRRGGLFFDEVPHARLLLQNQRDRRENGLNINLLASLRPTSPWFRGN